LFVEVTALPLRTPNLNFFAARDAFVPLVIFVTGDLVAALQL